MQIQTTTIAEREMKEIQAEQIYKYELWLDEQQFEELADDNEDPDFNVTLIERVNNGLKIKAGF